MSDSKSPDVAVDPTLSVEPAAGSDPTDDDPGLATGEDAKAPFVPRGATTRPASLTNPDLTEAIPPAEQATHGDPLAEGDNPNIAGYVPPVYDPSYEQVTR